MRRRGPKGAGQFEPIGWKEAIDEIAVRLGEIHRRRPESILPCSFAGTLGWVRREGMASRLFHRLGASRLERGICSSAGTAGLIYSMGAAVGMDVESFVDCRLIIIRGSNSITSNLHFWSIAQDAKRRGARLVAIDPLRSDTAAKCDEHIPISPGTDAALALSMAQVLIADDFLDRDDIERYAIGFDAFAARAADYPPERAAAITGIDAQRIVDLARVFAGTRPAAIRLNDGMQRVRGGANAVRAIACQPTLTGAWREAAGGFLLSSSDHVPVDNKRLVRPDFMPGWPDRLPRIINMSAIGDALLEAEPPVEAIVVYNSNPVAVAPDSKRVIAADALRWDATAVGGASLADIRRKGWIKLDLVADWLPPHESPEMTPELAARYPLALISPPHRNFLDPTVVNIASLSRTEGEPFCDLGGGATFYDCLVEVDVVG